VRHVAFIYQSHGAHFPKVYFHPAETETIAGAKVNAISGKKISKNRPKVQKSLRIMRKMNTKMLVSFSSPQHT
jgi:hypothetical protein